MKTVLMIFALVLSVSNAFSQSISDVSTAITLSPFVTATKILEVSAVGTLKVVQSTRSLVAARGVAGKEQIKDELLSLNEAMLAGQIKTIADVQEPALRELFEEILANEEARESISTLVLEGTELHRIATAITLVLILE